MPAYLTKIAVLLKAAKQMKINSVIDQKIAQLNTSKDETNDLKSTVDEVEKTKRDESKEIENEENKKKKEKEEFDSNLVALNYLAFVGLFLIIFSCDMAFWILIGS
jgi:hypothetical protein